MRFLRKARGLASDGIIKNVRSLSLRTSVSLGKPVNFTFDMTDRCQLRCLTCSKWKTPVELNQKEMETQEWKYVILLMKKWLGDFSFIFAGGEPFLRKDIMEISSFAKQIGVRPSVISNGCGFNSLAKNIVKSGLESVEVSLNGINPMTHDITRGVEGAYEKTLFFIKELNKQRKSMPERKLRLSINSILMPFNCEEAVRLVMWVRNEGIDGINFQPLDPPGSFHPYPVSGTGFTHPKGADGPWYRKNLAAGASEKMGPIIDQLINLKEKGFPIRTSIEALRRMEGYYKNPQALRRTCEIGISSFNIDPYGNVRFCFDMEPIGNILAVPPWKIYNSRKAVETRRKIRECKRTCHWAIL